MDFSQEWKSLWPISSVYSAPLFLSDAGGGGGSGGSDSSPIQSEEVGPLIFNPSPETLTHLTTSPSLYSPIPSPFPHLSISRFLESSDSILPSTSSSIGSHFGPEISRTPLPQNSLQLLRCPGSSSVFAFYPTGKNSDQVGFVLLSVKGAHFGVKVSSGSNALNHRIVKLLVNPVADSSLVSGGSCHEFTNCRFVGKGMLTEAICRDDSSFSLFIQFLLYDVPPSYS